jgi:hypothetical protein
MNVLKRLVSGHSKEDKNDEIPDAQPNHVSDNDMSHDDTVEDRKRLWSKVSGLIGKDTTSLLSLPVSLFEPISVLQSMCEPLRYAELIDRCYEQEDPIDRMCYVAAFLVALFSNYVRTKKPFNPVLGETFEFVHPHKNYMTLCEQVSHHPPIGIVHTISNEWTLQQESRIETKFWGNSVDIYGLGNNHLILHSHGDHFSWKNPASCCHNIIFGRMWIEHHGTVHITNNTNGDTAFIQYKKGGWFEGINFKIQGEIRGKDGALKAIISGKWNESVLISKVDEHGNKGQPNVIWKKPQEPVDENKWKWPRFLYELTALDEELELVLPPTDSRLRGDLRALTTLDMKIASKEKNKIEEKQRLKRRERDASGHKWSPAYFKKVPDDKFEYRWEYVGNYWEERELRLKEREVQKSSTKKDDKIQDKQPQQNHMNGVGNGDAHHNEQHEQQHEQQNHMNGAVHADSTDNSVSVEVDQNDKYTA